MADTWFKCEPTQFLLGMSRLDTPEQVLVYVAVCFRIYEVNGPVPNDASAFVPATRLGVRKVRNALDQLLEMGKLHLVGGELMNARAASELAARGVLSDKRSKAGKASGEARKPRAKSTADERSTSVPRTANESLTQNERGVNASLDDRSSLVQTSETAENREKQGTHVPYAGAREEDKDKRNPLPPPTGEALERINRVREEWGMPPLATPSAPVEMSPAEQAAAITRISNLSAPKSGEGMDVDISELTGWIMAEAKMAVPPMDLSLVTGWVRMGADVDRIIRPTVVKLAANSRSPIRAMRYFDRTIREQFDAENSRSSADSAYFASIIRKHSR